MELHMRNTTARLLTGLALLILAAWLCAFNDMRPVKAQIGPIGQISNVGSFAPGGGSSFSLTYKDGNISSTSGSLRRAVLTAS
jgi:hypothetical protein